MAASGVFQPIANAPLFSLITLRIPVSLRPTALAAMATIAMSGAPVGVVIVGPLVTVAGISVTVAALATALTASSVILVLWLPRLAGERSWRLRSAAETGLGEL
jgi:hypothetical protein